MTPQELEIQKKMSRLNLRLVRKRNQEISKAKVKDTETAPEQQVKEEIVLEKVKGEDTQRRKDDAAERRSGEVGGVKTPKRLSPSKGRDYVKGTKSSIEWWKNRKKVDEEVGISSTVEMEKAKKEAALRRKEQQAVDKEKKALKKEEFVNEGADQKRTTKGRWVDDQGRSHNFSVSTRTGDRGYITQFIKSKFPAKQVIVTGQSKETPPKKAVKEDRAFDNVVASLRAKHGKDAVITKDSPKPKPQPRQKPKPDTRTDAQKKADQHTANMDAVYGGKQRDRGLGT